MLSPPGDAPGGGDRTRAFRCGGGKYTRWPGGRQLFTMANAAGRAARRCRAASGETRDAVERGERHAHAGGLIEGAQLIEERARPLEALARDRRLAVAPGHLGPRAQRLAELVPGACALQQEER